MSTAGTAPPPYSSAPRSSNGDSRAPPSFNGGGERVFAHIDDLKLNALTGFSSAQSIAQLLSTASVSVNGAKFNHEHRRPDQAFVDYLRAFEIACNVIPRHKDYVDFLHDKHGKQKLDVLRRNINSLEPLFENIKNIIKSNNQRSGVKPASPNNGPRHLRTESDSVLPPPNLHKVKPAPSPKPDRLHGRPITHAGGSTNGAHVDLLTDRFAQLRASAQPDLSRSDIRTSDSSVLSFTPTDSFYNGVHSNTSSKTSFVTTKPQGPRDMPMPEADTGPPRPLKLPLDTQIAAALPKAPSPTYSPARNMQVTGNINPPRHTARSLAGSIPRKPTSSASAMAPYSNGDYFPGHVGSEAAPSNGPSRRSPVQSTRMTPDKLYSYLERFEMLIIDLRSRQEFDQGHIFARNIMCIEPIMMSHGISADQVKDKLEISPDVEQEMWASRDKFQLVVYYDAQTQSHTYLGKPRGDSEKALKSLHEALCDFNVDKPLKQPPMLLVGGLEAWADLMGNQALVATNTQNRQKANRPIQRRPLNVPKHRANREYNPLGREEERKWRERAFSESVARSSDSEIQSGFDDDTSVDQFEYPTIEDFNARFPDAALAGVATYESTITVYQRPERPAKVPLYPSVKAPSVYPQAPARPAPVAPRQSYIGVSDKAQAPHAPRVSSQSKPYLPGKYQIDRPIPRTGLYNFGSTCYMNATLQALSGTKALSNYFLTNAYQGSVQKNPLGSNGVLPMFYHNLLQGLWSGRDSVIKPTTFRDFSGRMNTQFKDPSVQQDAQEYLSWLIDFLHEDLNPNFGNSPPRALSEEQEARRDRIPLLAAARENWASYLHRDHSFLTNLFYGQEASRMQCPRCGGTSTTFTPSAILSLTFPPESRGQEVSIQTLLRRHFKREVLDDSNAWRCPRCGPGHASKELLFTRLPPVLVVQFVRFGFSRGGAAQEKLRAPVRFPLTGLDMGEFMLPPPTAAEQRELATIPVPEGLRNDGTAMEPPYVYDAYAVVQHMGQNTRSGHYTAAVKDSVRGCWRRFNDTRSEDFRPEEGKEVLDDERAYMVFYERRGQ